MNETQPEPLAIKSSLQTARVIPVSVPTIAPAQQRIDTPMLRQYLELKSQVGDAILFFRMGDFYEMFLEDAVRAAPILDLTLTSRNKGNPDEVPLCGFPYHQLEEYVAKVILQGQKVAVCEQVLEFESGKKVFRREVARIVTPGLVTQGEGALGADAYRARFIVGIVEQEKTLGLAYLDISTGEFATADFSSVDLAVLLSELVRLNPAEILLGESAGADRLVAFLRQKLPGTVLTMRANLFYPLDIARSKLSESFGVIGLQGLGLGEIQAGVIAACALYHYADETQCGKISHLRRLRSYSILESLRMDAATRRNLDLVRNTFDGSKKNSLYAALDVCHTRQGSRLLEFWIQTPLKSVAEINQRLDAVEALAGSLRSVSEGTNQLISHLKHFADLERITAKLALGTVTPRDCVALGNSLQLLPDVQKSLQTFSNPLLGQLNALLTDASLQQLSRLIASTLKPDAGVQTKDGGYVREGLNPELDELRLLMKDTKSFIAGIESEERQKTGISTLKVKFNKVFGYYLEITKSNLALVPDYFIRKQTLVNAERYIVPKLKEFEEKLLHAEERALKLESEIYFELKETLKRALTEINQVSKAIAQIDCLLSFAAVALEWHYVRPVLTEDLILQIESGRHPVLERLVARNSRSDRFIPNDLDLNVAERQILIITGPNMAGKSTVMRQSALIVLMAQCGSFVPAKRATIGITDGIYSRVGANDFLSQGQSTFMVEMNETASILNQATRESFIILDEIGRGTSTLDGLSIAWAVGQYLHEKIGARTLFATHYHELADLALQYSRIVNSHIAVKEWNGEILFLRKLLPGATNRSYGIEVGRLAGLPDEVLQLAKEKLLALELHFHEIGKSKTADPAQIALFQPPKADLIHPREKDVLDEIRVSEPDRLSPLESLQLLHRLHAHLGSIR